MLVGESKPYCGVLIWAQKDHWNEKTSQTIDHAVEEINRRLSNPEKIKKWALLVNNLKIENGDLTPTSNLNTTFWQNHVRKSSMPCMKGPFLMDTSTLAE